MKCKSKLKRMNRHPMGELVIQIGCLMVLLIVGGGCSRYEKECAALRNLIEEKGRQQDEKISQMSDRVWELKKNLVDLSSDLKTVSRRIEDMEATRKQHNEDFTSQAERLGEKYNSLVERFESLSRQVTENSSAMRQLERHNHKSNVVFSEPTQPLVQNKPIAQGDPPGESIDDLQQKLNKNLKELKQLVQENPACYLNPKSTSIINLDRKIATAKDRRYCTCNNITFVRDRFYCTGCKRVTGIRNGDYEGAQACCEVSSQQSFYRWVDARKQVDKTTQINLRIDEIYAENESLEKKIRSMKNSHRRR